MLNNVLWLEKQYKIGSARLDECNGKLIEDLKTLKACGEILIFLFSHPDKLSETLSYSNTRT